MNHSDKIKEGIEKARANGVIWGKSGKDRAAESKMQADEYAASLCGVVLDVLRSTKRQWRYVRIAQELTARGVTAPEGGVLHGKTVSRLLKRMPAVVAAANDFHNVKEHEDFLKHCGTSLPTSPQETVNAITSEQTTG